MPHILCHNTLALSVTLHIFEQCSKRVKLLKMLPDILRGGGYSLLYQFHLLCLQVIRIQYIILYTFKSCIVKLLNHQLLYRWYIIMSRAIDRFIFKRL